ncbi:hypothetical protein [Taklimakanibacter lacteus]|uniref:hypothetical protein n=1 Tax=Taklimakanibacter lacteus TaxID=2268456 RepID=UPI000E66DA3A
MKTAIATTLLAILLLNAGAFASDNRIYLKSAASQANNITVLTKNQAWPVRTQMTVEPCTLADCIGV